MQPVCKALSDTVLIRQNCRAERRSSERAIAFNEFLVDPDPQWPFTGNDVVPAVGGLSVIFGLMRIINLAHGSFYLIGGYIALTIILATGQLLARASRCASARRMRRCGRAPSAIAARSKQRTRPGAADLRLPADDIRPDDLDLGWAAANLAAAGNVLEGAVHIAGLVFPTYRDRAHSWQACCAAILIWLLYSSAR